MCGSNFWYIDPITGGSESGSESAVASSSEMLDSSDDFDWNDFEKRAAQATEKAKRQTLDPSVIGYAHPHLSCILYFYSAISMTNRTRNLSMYAITWRLATGRAPSCTTTRETLALLNRIQTTLRGRGEVFANRSFTTIRQPLILDVYPTNHMRLYDLTADMRSLALGVGFYNQTNRPGSALTLIYSLYDHTSQTFTQPKPIKLDDVSENTPTAVKWNDTTYIALWTRTSTWDGLNTTDINALKAWAKTAEVVWATYDIASDKWSALTTLTSDSTCNIGVNSVAFTKNGSPRVMAIYNADDDGDLFQTQTDRAYHYSIYDGSSWTTPTSMAFYGGLGETTLTVYKDTIFYGFLSSPKNGTGTLYRRR